MRIATIAAALSGAALVLCCSPRDSGLVFEQGPDGAWTATAESMDSWAEAVAGADSAEAVRLLDYGYSIADSLAAGEEEFRTLEVFALDVADRFLSLNSPLYNERVYDMALDREWRCENWNSWGRRGTDWRRHLLNLNRAGTRVSDFWLSSRGESPDTLLRQLLPGAPVTVLFIYGESCKACDKLIREISRCKAFRKMAESGEAQFISLYTGEDWQEFVSKASSLPGYWSNWSDREAVVKYNRAFDTRMIPSLYLIDSDGIVLLRGARTVKDCLSFYKKY